MASAISQKKYEIQWDDKGGGKHSGMILSRCGSFCRHLKIGYEKDLLESMKFVNDHIYKMLRDREQVAYCAVL